MKKGVSDVGFYFDEDKTSQDADSLLGVSLGWDHAAEHEWGIAGIKSMFGIPTKRSREHLGLEGCRISRLVGEYLFVGPHFLVADTYNLMYAENQDEAEPGTILNHYDHALYLNKGSKFNTKEEVAGCWDGDSFGLIVAPENELFVSYLDLLVQAFEKLDVAIHIPGSNNPFANGGLCLSIYSRIPQKHRDVMAAGDLAQIELTEAGEDSIKAVMDALASGPIKPPYGDKTRTSSYYFSLRPAWKAEKNGELMFWLNPCQQDAYRSGWFSLEQLLEWAQQNTGPVCKAWVEAKETEQLQERETQNKRAIKEAIRQHQEKQDGSASNDTV